MSSVRSLLRSPESDGVSNQFPQRSVVGSEPKTMWGLMSVKGRFTDFSGDGQITETGAVFGRLDIKAASLNTKIGMRDAHLRSGDFFDVQKYPGISVVVTGAEPAEDDTLDVRADLTVKETTAPLPLRAKVVVHDDGVRVTAHTTIDRTQFGVGGNMLGMVGDKTTVSADLVFRRATG